MVNWKTDVAPTLETLEHYHAGQRLSRYHRNRARADRSGELGLNHPRRANERGDGEVPSSSARTPACHPLPGSISTKPNASERSGSWRSFKAREPGRAGLGRHSQFHRRSPLPGTSTIQTGLRYMLFVPWLFRMLESSGTLRKASFEPSARARRSGSLMLLKAGGESNGIIGRDAGPLLQRLPSSVYWAGLGSWGIRLFPGSIDSSFLAAQLYDDRAPLADGEDPTSGQRVATAWSKPYRRRRRTCLIARSSA